MSFQGPTWWEPGIAPTREETLKIEVVDPEQLEAFVDNQVAEALKVYLEHMSVRVTPEDELVFTLRTEGGTAELEVKCDWKKFQERLIVSFRDGEPDYWEEEEE